MTILTEPGFTRRLHLDFETFSRSNLKKEGVHMYAADPSTEALMLGWAFNDNPVQLWLPSEEPMPPALRDALYDDDCSVHAFNAPFERLILRDVLGMEIPLHRYRCTMVEAYYLGFAGTLDQVLKAIGLPPKDSRGHRLIHTFCTPNPSNYKKDRYGPEDKPEDWEAFKQYCIQDVEVERQLWRWLRKFPTMHAWDWQQWFVDQQINDRGVPMDLEMAAAAQEIWTAEKAALTEDLKDLTGLPKVTRDPFKAWVNEALYPMYNPLENLRKDDLEYLIKEECYPVHVKEALELWMQKEGKAVSKYTSAANGTGSDGRARGMFQYKGAGRTDRSSGRRLQLQNLRRPNSETFKDIDNVVAAIKLRHAPMLRFLYKEKVSDTIGAAVRHMIHAQPGNTFVVADLASIESVVLGWVSDCKPIDTLFRAGKDSYKVFASQYYGIPYEEVTKEQRTFCKPPVLGAGFMLGWKGLIKYAEGMGVTMTAKEAKLAIKTFREMYPEIVQFWHWVYGAVKSVTLTGKEVTGHRLRIERDADFLRIWLPSGRALSYYLPEVRKKVAPWAEHVMTEKAGGADYDAFIAQGWNDYTLVQHGYMKPLEMVDNFCYMGMNDNSQWVRIFAHAGGVTENIVQSIAGDLLWNGNMKANARGLPIILHVHDEIAAEVARAQAERDLQILMDCMTDQPPWAQDMWLGAAGYVNDRYTKD